MKIVSLCPSVTETVFALGRGADLVGVTKFCVHPSPAVNAIERVGGTKDPAITRILSLAPDLVLMNREENRLQDAEALRYAGLKVRASMPTTVLEVAEDVRELGEAIGEPLAATRLANEITERAAEVRDRSTRLPKLVVAYLIWREPWMAVASGTYVDDLLGLGGAQNLFAQHEDRYPVFDPLELRLADRVLLSSEPFRFREHHIQELSTLTGLEPKRFKLVDGESFSWHGARTLCGLANVGSALR